MGLLNKNIEAALASLEASEEDKQILQDILYKEHLNKERNWDESAPSEISAIIREHASEGGKNDIY